MVTIHVISQKQIEAFRSVIELCAKFTLESE